MAKQVAVWVLLLAVGCSSHGATTGGSASGGVSGDAGSSGDGSAGLSDGGDANGGDANGGDANGGDANGGDANGGGANGGDANQAGASGEGGAASGVAYLPLPKGSRALADVVNLVDAQAAAQLEEFLTKDSNVSIFEQHGLDVSLNLFLDHYEEVYDFVFFLTDHPLPQTNYIGKFEPVTRPPLRGTGTDIEIFADNYKTNGRVRGVIGIQYLTGQFGPFCHEISHYWANNLDPKFGFDKPHWGFAGLHATECRQYS
jgi:hypothetical protein